MEPQGVRQTEKKGAASHLVYSCEACHHQCLRLWSRMLFLPRFPQSSPQAGTNPISFQKDLRPSQDFCLSLKHTPDDTWRQPSFTQSESLLVAPERPPLRAYVSGCFSHTHLSAIYPVESICCGCCKTGTESDRVILGCPGKVAALGPLGAPGILCKLSGDCPDRIRGVKELHLFYPG